MRLVHISFPSGVVGVVRLAVCTPASMHTCLAHVYACVYMCMSVYMCAYACARVCGPRARARAYPYTRGRMRACQEPHACVYSRMRACAHANAGKDTAAQGEDAGSGDAGGVRGRGNHFSIVSAQ